MDTDNLLQNVLDAVTQNIAVIDMSGYIIYTNSSWNRFAQQNGNHNLHNSTIGDNYLKAIDVTTDNYAKEAKEGLERVLHREESHFQLEYPCHSPDEKRWFIMEAIRQEKNVVVTHYDISSRRLLEMKPHNSELLLTAILNNVVDGIITMKSDGIIQSTNKSVSEIFGYAPEELLGKPVTKLMPEPYKSEHQSYIENYLNTKVAKVIGINREVFGQRKNGSIFPLELAVAEVNFLNEIYFVGRITDISNKLDSEFKLSYFLAQNILNSSKNLAYVGYVNFHNLLLINWYDLFSKELLPTLNLPDSKLHLIGRIEPSSFLIFLPDQYEDYCNDLIQKLKQPMGYDGGKVYLNPSIGIVNAKNNNDTLNRMIANAKVASEVAKKEQLEFVLYNEDIDRKINRETRLLKDIQTYLEKDLFTLQYQPLEDMKSGKIIGFEALSRWVHDDLGNVSPDEFIPLIEDSQFDYIFGMSVIEKVCKQMQSWQNQGYTDFYISINITTVQLENLNFYSDVAKILLKYGQVPEYFKFEVTERGLIHRHATVKDNMDGLNTYGIKFLMDDFGTVNASLSYLHHYPFSGIKIDRSFILAIPNDIHAFGITKTAIDLGNSLDLTVTVEGLEVGEEIKYEYLKGLGCDVVQGYLISKPLNKEKAILLIENNTKEHKNGVT